MRMSKPSTVFNVPALLVAALIAVPIAPSVQAQPQPQPQLRMPSGPVSSADREAVIRAAIRELNARYVFEDVAKKVGQSLSAKLASREFDGIDDAAAFAMRLTYDIQAIAKDKHIRVTYSPSALPERVEATQPTEAEIAAERRSEERINFGIERVERLPLNVGYIDLRGFSMAQWAGDSIAAAMSLLAHTEALIVDLRRNGGGDPAAVALLTSYLLDERTHLNSFFVREGSQTRQSWSHDWVPGKRFGGKKPVYVLTSSRTFSGAEEFSYNLKNLKRATLVGETTGGGANPGGVVRLSAHFSIFVPDGRAINPITQTNWEGVGVEPDVKVIAADALRIARLMALKALKQSETDPRRLRAFDDQIAELTKAAPA
jgi:retinol-binding protein 3